MINFLKKALPFFAVLAGFVISVSILTLLYYATVLIFLLE